ncbi:MAG: PAS domain S-box protein, partial [Bacillota bacterium]
MFDFSGIKKEKYNSLIIGIIIFLLIVFFVAFYYVYKLSYQSEVDSFLDHQDIYISVVRKKFKDRLDTIIQQPYNTRIKNREKAKLLSSDLEFPSLPEIKYTALLESSKNITTAVNQFEPGVDLEKIRGKIKTVTEKKWSDIDANYYIAPLEITKRHQLALVFYPVQTKNDKQILASVIDLEELTAEYIAPIQLKKNGTGYLIDGRGRVIYDRATEIIGSNVFNLHQTYEKLLAVDKKMINQEQGSAHYNFLLRKTGESKHKYISWASINFGSNKLILAISTPKSDIIAEMNDFRNKLMILSILLIIMLLLIGIIFFKLNSQVLKSKIEEYQEKYEEQTKELRMMSEMVEQSDDSMMQTDTKGNIEYINRAGEELFGWSREEIVGKKPAIFNAEENDRQIQNEIYQALEQGEKYEIELLNQRKDGSVFWC